MAMMPVDVYFRAKWENKKVNWWCPSRYDGLEHYNYKFPETKGLGVSAHAQLALHDFVRPAPGYPYAGGDEDFAAMRAQQKRAEDEQRVREARMAEQHRRHTQQKAEEERAALAQRMVALKAEVEALTQRVAGMSAEQWRDKRDRLSGLCYSTMFIALPDPPVPGTFLAAKDAKCVVTLFDKVNEKVEQSAALITQYRQEYMALRREAPGEAETVYALLDRAKRAHSTWKNAVVLLGYLIDKELAELAA